MNAVVDAEAFLNALPEDGTPVSNATLIARLGWPEDDYWLLKRRLVEQGRVLQGKGRSGSVRRADGVSKNPLLPTLDVVLDDELVEQAFQMLLDLGELSLDDLRALCGNSAEQTQALQEALAKRSRVSLGPRRVGGVVYNAAQPGVPAAGGRIRLLDWQQEAATLLSALLSHGKLAELVGELDMTLRRLFERREGKERRGTKDELAAALVIKHDRDLLAVADLREALAKAMGIEAPKRWVRGCDAAHRFCERAGFPLRFAGDRATDVPDEVELLSGPPSIRKLESYQLELTNKVVANLDARAPCIATLPTGAGKTRVAVEAIHRWLSARDRDAPPTAVVWLAHTEELCEQACESFKDVWTATPGSPDSYLIRFWGQYLRDVVAHREVLGSMQRRSSFFVSTPQRFLNFLQHAEGEGREAATQLLSALGTVIIDEAHRAGAPTYRQIISRVAGTSRAALLGLTATPVRKEYDRNDPQGGTEDLIEVFRELVEPDEFRDTYGDIRTALQSKKVLARPVLVRLNTGFSMRVPNTGWGDPLTQESAEMLDRAFALAADRTPRRLAIFEKILPYAREPDCQMLYFGPTVRDAECMAFLLRQECVDAGFLSGETHVGTRRRIVNDFKNGRIRVLCNCSVLTTGFDAPRVTHVVVARPTVSHVLYEQMVGRGLRGKLFGGTDKCVIVNCEDELQGVRKPQLGQQLFRELWLPGER